MFTSDTTYTTRGNMIEMKVTGGAELMKKFQSIKAEMWKGFAAALVAGGFPVTNEAKELAAYLTGNMRRSIHLGTETRDITKPQATDGAPQIPDMSVVATVARDLQTTGKAKILAGTDVEYAPVQEFLHKAFLRPALDNNRKEVEDEVKRAVKMVIEKAKI